METELEAKWLHIDKDILRASLKQLGATLVKPERMMIRRTFDLPDDRLREIGGWARVRDEGDRITMSYKQLNDRTLQGTKEVTVTVDDFNNACAFLTAIGLTQKSFQETKRESWKLGDTEIELDTWPWIPSFIEIEAKSESELFAVAEKLGLDRSQALHGSVEPAYQAVYNVTEDEIDNWDDIRFSETPSWLAAKRK